MCNKTVSLDKSLLLTNYTSVVWQQNNLALDFDAEKTGVDREAIQVDVIAAADFTNFLLHLTAMPLLCQTNEIQNLRKMAHNSTVSDLINKEGNIYSITIFLAPQSSAPSNNNFPVSTKSKMKEHNKTLKFTQQLDLLY